MLLFSYLEILRKRTLNYIALNFPSTRPVEDDDYFPPPPPDALGLPPKQSHGSLEEIEVFKQVKQITWKIRG